LHYHCQESKIWIVQCQYCDFSTILTTRIHDWKRYDDTHLKTCTYDFGNNETYDFGNNDNNFDQRLSPKHQLLLKYKLKEMDETTAEFIMDIDKLIWRWKISWGCAKSIIETLQKYINLTGNNSSIVNNEQLHATIVDNEQLNTTIVFGYIFDIKGAGCNKLQLCQNCFNKMVDMSKNKKWNAFGCNDCAQFDIMKCGGIQLSEKFLNDQIKSSLSLTRAQRYKKLKLAGINEVYIKIIEKNIEAKIDDYIYPWDIISFKQISIAHAHTYAGGLVKRSAFQSINQYMVQFKHKTMYKEKMESVMDEIGKLNLYWCKFSSYKHIGALQISEWKTIIRFIPFIYIDDYDEINLMHFLIGSVASAIHNKDLQSLETLLKMFLYEVELLHAFVYEEWMDSESLTTKLKVTIQQTNNTTRYGGMTKKEIMFYLSSIKNINIKKTLKSFNGKLNMENLRYILRYVVNNDNNGITPPDKKKHVVNNDNNTNTIQIFYLPQADENEAIPLFKRRSLHLSAIANLKDNLEMIENADDMRGEKSINATHIKEDVAKTNFKGNYIERALINNLAYHFAVDDTTEKKIYKKMIHNYKNIPSFTTNIISCVVVCNKIYIKMNNLYHQLNFVVNNIFVDNITVSNDNIIFIAISNILFVCNDSIFF
jgi:hypothetical protein